MNTMQLSYGRTNEVDLDFNAALARAKVQLAKHGFGVLCEIDVAATLRAKLASTAADVDARLIAVLDGVKASAL